MKYPYVLFCAPDNVYAIIQTYQKIKNKHTDVRI